MASQKIVAGGLVMSVGIRMGAPAIDSRSYCPLLSNRVRSLVMLNLDMTESYTFLMISAKNRSQLQYVESGHTRRHVLQHSCPKPTTARGHRTTRSTRSAT
jgi:hypothetical protein